MEITLDRLLHRSIALVFASLIIATAQASVSHKATSYIAKSGKAGCVLILPDDATPGETYAAKELKDHIKQITRVELNVVPERLYSSKTGRFVSIGRTKISKKYVTDEQLKALGDDGYCVFNKRGSAFFVGGRKRGSMYAVYQYLESLGVRWYAPDYTVLPKITDIKMPSEPFDYKPSFWYRDQWWNNNATSEWLARMRVNGNNGQDHELPDSMGGSVVTVHGCHSYAILVPPNENFSKHPNWYALKEGGSRSQSELCLTNPELRDFVVNRVLTDLRARSGKVDNYWVSQNDGGGSGCFCERCTEQRLAHGGKDRWSANTIGFTGYVADKVGAEFPEVHIKTLAYNYTQPAPEKMSAPDNVLVEICGNFGEGDSTQAKLVSAWSKVAKRISVYTYGGSNYGYWWPYPNMSEMAMQCPRALACGVKAFYMQGAALGKGSGMVELRAYLIARLSWDPSRDVNKEIRDFCDGYYGPGGKYIAEYESWYAAYCKQHKMVVDSAWGDPDRWRDWVTKEAMVHSDELFQKALAATKANPIYQKHVRQAYLEVLWGGVMIDTKRGTDLMNKELTLLPNADADAVRLKAKLYGEIMRENGYNQILEAVTYDPNKYPH